MEVLTNGAVVKLEYTSDLGSDALKGVSVRPRPAPPLQHLSDRALIQGLQRAVLNARHGRSTSGEISPFVEEAARRWGGTNIDEHYRDLMAKHPCLKRTTY